MSNEWTTWKSLQKPGGTDRFVALALGNHQNGRLALFAGGSHGELFHRAETDGGSWSDWERIGDDTGHVNYLDLTVSRYTDGRLAVFTSQTTIRSPSEPPATELRHLVQTAPNGGWGRWESLGSPQAAGGFFNHRNTRRRVGVGTNADGRLEVFLLHFGNSNSSSPVADVWHIWQTAQNGSWSHWEKLGAIPKRSPAWPFNLEVASNQDGRQELFLVGETVGLWHVWQTAPNNGWGCWRDEEYRSWDRLAVGRNPDGRLEVFLTDGTEKVSHTFQTEPNGGWSEWLDLETPEGVRPSTLAVETQGDGRLVLVAKDDSNAGSFWHIEQTEPGGTDWNEWVSLGRPRSAADMPTNPNLSAFVVGRNQSDRLQLLASDRDGEVWTIAQR